MGLSNSPFRFSFEIGSAGVDTWSPAWQLDPHSDRFHRFRGTCPVASARGSRLLGSPIGGHRVGCYPTGLVFAEGHPTPGELCPPAQLLEAGLRLQEQLVDSGVPVNPREMPFVGLGTDSEGFVGLRRLDATVNVHAATGAEGVALLAGIAAVAKEGLGHTEVRFGRDRGVETVYFRGYAGKRMLGRWYDKALEAAVGARGTVIRGEDQRRWDKQCRRMPDDWTAEAVRHGFERRFLPLYRASKGVVVGGPMVVAERLREAIEAGELTPRQAEVLAGHVLLTAGAGPLYSGTTEWRRRRELQGLGLVLGDGVLQEVEVNVHDVLEMALQGEVWGCG